MLRLPEAAGGVLEDGGPLGVARLGVLVGLVLPARVRDDDLVGHGLQAVVDDHHLQGLVGRQVPQGSCQGRGRVTIKAEEEEEVLGWGGEGGGVRRLRKRIMRRISEGIRRVKDEEEPSEKEGRDI